MSLIAPSRTLRHALIADAIISGGAGLLQVAGGTTVVSLLGMPPSLVLGSGLFMLVYAAALVGLARAQALRGLSMAIVVVGNFAWADACIALSAFDVVSQTPLGTAWLIVQGLAVTALAAWQGIGWRTSRRVASNDAALQGA
jgi:hypothetical protein